jgi:putative ABC transport system permease protein
MIGVGVGVALVVMVLASLGGFFSASRARMTMSAKAGVPVDWQVQLAPGANARAAERTIRGTPGVTTTRLVGYGPTTGLRASVGGTVQTTGPGAVVGIPTDYATTFDGEIRPLVGQRSGVLLAQQTAANLHAGPGTVVRIGLPGSGFTKVRVDGIVDLPQADSMFQAVGTPAGAAPRAPPDNVVLLPLERWQRIYAPVASGGLSVHLQIHARLASDLPNDPGVAFADVLARARNLEARFAGRAVVGSNLAAQLDAIRTDATYAELLFLLLGVPAAALAAVITIVLGASGGDRRRREQALLRIRGATPGRLVAIAAAEAAASAIIGVILGLGGAAVAARAAFGATSFGATSAQAIGWTAGSVAAGVVVALVSVVFPAWRDARTMSVRASQAAIGAARRPLWARLYLDLVLLAAAGLVFWQAVGSGYQVLLAPEGVPTISVSFFTLLAPFFFWVGATLLIWRLGSGALARGRRPLARAVRPIAHGLSGVVAASMSRQGRLLARGLLIMALSAAFALSTAVFNATYQAQARVDAELTNGADVAATTAASGGLPAGIAERVRRLPGVVADATMEHRFAYVGNDLQDLYGIDPDTIGHATPMSDAFFAGGNADASLSALASRPDGALVSAETVHDFQLRPGDLLRLRLQFANEQGYRVVPFHYVGVVREFPTAPRDSFIVANGSYVARRTGSSAVQTLLVRVSANPPEVAARIRRLLGPASGATVRDIESQLSITLSGLTAIDLSGLTRLELTFAIVLGVAVAGLVLALGASERRRTFAIASAVGARTRQLASFVWSESVFVTAGGLALGGLTGWGIAFVIVKILTGVFDPPPQHLIWPWTYLTVVFGAMAFAVAIASLWMIRATRRLAVEVVRDL